MHDEADRLEHALSEELEARIDEALGFPTHDPHGDPIPDANLEWPEEPVWRDRIPSAPMALKDCSRSSSSARPARSASRSTSIREHDRGRPLSEILEDRYVVNRLTSPEQRARLLDRPEIIQAVGGDTAEAAKASLGPAGASGT